MKFALPSDFWSAVVLCVAMLAQPIYVLIASDGGDATDAGAPKPNASNAVSGQTDAQGENANATHATTEK
jgi:hypothetical protein